MGRISMPQGKGSMTHNRRDFEKEQGKIKYPKHINPERTSENITFVDKNIREVYREVFGEALAKYNAKQKRSDRKIDDYYDHIAKSKNGEKLFYEDVLQWGDKDDFCDENKRELAKKCLCKYIEGFEKRNPNLKLIGAFIHMDEASPHLHFDYVPVAHGNTTHNKEKKLNEFKAFSRGLSTRNSLDKAMKEMGHVPENESKNNNATKLWKESERAVFKAICLEYGLEVEDERKARGSLSVQEYKDVKDKTREEALAEVNEELAKKNQEITELDNKIASLERKYKDVTTDVRKYDPENWVLEQGFMNIVDGKEANNVITKLCNKIKNLMVNLAKLKGKNEELERENGRLKKNEVAFKDKNMMSKLHLIQERGLMNEFDDLFKKAQSNEHDHISKKRNQEL